MRMKKLTAAAAIAVGIATCSLSQAMAACPCTEKAPTVTGSACPVEDTMPVVTGVAGEKPQVKCNSCKKTLPDCDCKKSEPAPCDPCLKKKSDCGCNKKEEISCDKPAIPAAALCPQSGKPDKAEMKQVYAYPQAIYGTNNYVGERSNSILSTETAKLMPHRNGVTISFDEAITGAASKMPCLNELPSTNNGIGVKRNEAKMDNNSCPIDFQTENSIQVMKKTWVPFDLKPFVNQITGAAADVTGNCMFPDVPRSYWASCDIDKLAMNDVVVGYPDGNYKPGRSVSRAEFATMLVKGFNLDTCSMDREKIFKDVALSHWANAAISKAVNENLLKGYSNNLFKPNNHVTRAEALTSIAKGMTCDIDECKANEILKQYTDGASVPSWARIPVAKSLESGALKDSPNPNMIMPNKNATRADVASMLQTVRVGLGYDTNPKTANEICPACPIDKKVFTEEQEIVKLPTLKLSMIDQINAKSSHVGQYFRAKTLEDVTINGTKYPCGSIVTGQVVEIIRPSGADKGAIKLSFTTIQHEKCSANLPKQILNAQINKSKNVNPVARFVEMPFTLAGSLVGIVGRTTGGLLSNLGNAVENISNDSGYMLGHAFQGEFGAAARNLGDGLWETAKAPVDITRTALSGTMGLFQTTGDEVAYLVDPKGYKISAVNPKEHITIAFGCNE